MKKTGKTAWKVALIALIVCAAAVIGYFALFHHADVVRVEDGKAVNTKPTWLIAERDGQYYKLADVSAPKNYASVKDAVDLDGDPVTTQFVYQGKDAEKNPGLLTVVGLPADAAQLPAGQTVVIGGVEYPYTADAAQGLLTCVLPSPYEDTAIQVTVRLEPWDEAAAADLCALMGEKVTPGKQMASVVADFKLNFLDDNRWQYLWSGLGNTLEITLFAVLIGIVLGALVASIRSTWDKNEESMRKGVGRTVLYGLNQLSKLYLTVIRGTPVVIQLMISYYVIFTSSRNGVLIAILAFGINSGAYVAEIIRSGIISIDAGQFEAGRSLGFNYAQTMWYVIIPQAFKNVLPALANEFIVLLKETSVAGYVAVRDLTKGGDIIRSVTYSPFMPLIAVALIYLILVVFFTWLVGKLERRLRNSDH